MSAFFGCCDFRCYLKETISCMYNLTLPFYVVTVLLLVTSKDLRHSFFILFISSSLADIYFIIRPKLQLTLYESLAANVDSNVSGTLLEMTTWYFSRAEYLGILLTAINRFTAMRHPTKQELVRSGRLHFSICYTKWHKPVNAIEGLQEQFVFRNLHKYPVEFCKICRFECSSFARHAMLYDFRFGAEKRFSLQLHFNGRSHLCLYCQCSIRTFKVNWRMIQSEVNSKIQR